MSKIENDSISPKDCIAYAVYVMCDNRNHSVVCVVAKIITAIVGVVAELTRRD